VVKLKNVMDKTRLVVEVNLPDTSVGDPHVWESSADGNIVLARIEDGVEYEKDWAFSPEPGEWRFTPETIRAIPALYRAKEREGIKEEVRQTGVEERLSLGLWVEQRVPESMRREFLSLAIWKWLALAGVLLLGWPVDLLVAALVGLVLGGWLKRKKITVDREVRRRAFRSTGAAGTAIFWWHVIGADYLVLGEWIVVLLPLAKVITGVTTVWVSYRLVDVLGGYIAANRDVQLTHFDDVLIPLLTKILRVVVVVVSMLLVLELLGIRATTVLGVLGVGGVAIAFAAQDTIGNFFGSITVLFDRPFGIGDWIAIGDVEGTVERVGFRSTRVRTFYNSVITIPNSQMVNTQVDNYGARRYRRVKTTLSVTYDTPPERIDAFCEGVRELILLHPYTRKDYYHVYFNQFAGSSLDVLLYAFFEVPDWSTELRERHQLFMDILRLAKRLDVSFAFPTQTVHLERASVDAPRSSPVLSGDPGIVGVDQAATLYQDGYGATPGPRKPVVIETKPRSQRTDG
jgi:MscS family membrane protein